VPDAGDVTPVGGTDPLRKVADAPIGVFAYVRRDGTPNAVPVTPFVVDGKMVVTSTLAYVAKAAAVRRDPHVALLAGGIQLATTASVAVDRTPAWFNTHIRDAEIEKFPPTKQFLAIPFHECLFPWYSARVVIGLDPADVTRTDRGDRVTITTIDPQGLPRITPIDQPVDQPVDEHCGALEVPGVGDGPAVVLVHEEHDAMADLRQLTLVGVVRAGRFTVHGHRGSLAPQPTSLGAQLATIRSMRRSARSNRDRVADWPVAVAS